MSQHEMNNRPPFPNKRGDKYNTTKEETEKKHVIHRPIHEETRKEKRYTISLKIKSGKKEKHTILTLN
jgi:hypothetical protein